MKPVEQLFKGLAELSRLRILNLLMQGELCVCDIQYVLESPQPNVSRHLIYLKNSGLVVDRREGARVYYRINQTKDAVQQQLFAFLQRVFASEPSFTEDARRLKGAIETGACTVSEWRPHSGVKRRHRTEPVQHH